MNKAEDALPLFKTAVEVNPKIEQFWLSYIDAFIKENQFETATEVLEKGKKQGVTGEKLNALEAQLTLITQAEDSKLPEQKKSLTFSEKRKKLSEKKQKKKAQRQNINAISPSEADLNNLLQQYQNGRYDDAEKLALSITERFPEHLFAWKVLGAVLKQTGRVSDSLVASQKSVQLAPQDAEAHYNLGVTLKELDRLEEVEASYRQAIALKSDYVEAHNNLGVTLKELDRLEEAEASYRQAIALKSDYALAHNNLGVTLQELGRLEEAEASYRQAITVKPDYAKAHYNLGLVLQTLGNIDAAAAVFRASCNHDPASHMSLFYLHSTYYRDMNTDFDAAIKCLNEAVQIAPTDGLINFFLGMLLDYKGQEEKAEHYFSLVHENMSVNYAQFESWSWVKSTTSQYPLLFWQKYDGFDYAFDAAQLDGLILEFGVAHGASIRKTGVYDRPGHPRI